MLRRNVMTAARACWWREGDEIVVQNVIGVHLGQQHRHTPEGFERWRKDAEANGFEVVEHDKEE